MNNPFAERCEHCQKDSVTVAGGTCADCCIRMDAAFRGLAVAVAARIEDRSCHESGLTLDEAKALTRKIAP